MDTSEPSRSVGPLLIWSSIALVLIGSAGQPIASNDLHVFMAMGRWMAEHGTIMQADRFTWTAHGSEFIHGTWGFSWLSWTLYEHTGLFGLRLFNGLCASGALLLLYQAAKNRKAQPKAIAFAIFFAAGMLIQNLGVRSQTWAFPLFASLVWILSKPRPLPLILPLIGGIGAIWSNLHGSFPAGLVFLGATGLGRSIDQRSWAPIARTSLLAIAFVLGTAIGPNGLSIYEFVLGNSALPQARGLTEWARPEWWSLSSLRISLGIAIWALLFAKGPKHLSWEQSLCVLVFAALAVTGGRFIAWFGLAAAVPLACRLDATMLPSPGMKSGMFRNVTVIFGLFWSIILLKNLWPKSNEMSEKEPKEAVAAIAESAESGRIFNPPSWGGYAIFELNEPWKISTDIRVWVFDDKAWNTYPQIALAPEGWEDLLEHHRVSHLLLRTDGFHGRLIPLAEESPQWALLHKDTHSAAFQRIVPTHGP